MLVLSNLISTSERKTSDMTKVYFSVVTAETTHGHFGNCAIFGALKNIRG